MRKLLLPLALLPIMAAAQCTYSRNEVDPFTGDKIVTTKLTKIKAKTAIGAGVYLSGGSVSDAGGALYTLTIALIPSNSLGCVTSTSKAIFLWDDGTTEEYSHIGDIKCSNPYHLMSVEFGSKLHTVAPSKVRLYYSKGYIDIDLLDSSVVTTLSCLTNP
jgi:hypothetical protein